MAHAIAAALDALMGDEQREAAAAAIEAELQRRAEWYGLDNWTNREVVDFVLAAVLARTEGDRT